MNFSLEIWKRSFQRLGLADLGKHPSLPPRESSSVEDDEEEDEEEEDEEQGEDDDGMDVRNGFRKIEESHTEIMRVLETRLTYKEAQILSLKEKLAAALKSMDEKEKEIADMARENESKDQENVELRKEWDGKMADWIKKEEAFVAEIQELASVMEDKCAAWNSALADVRIERDRSTALESSLREKIEELRCSREARNGLESQLQALRGEMDEVAARLREKVAEKETLDARVAAKDQLLQTLREEMDRAAAQLRVVAQFHDKVAENDKLKRELGEKVAELSRLTEETGDLRAKTSRLEEQMRDAQEERHRLKSMLAAASLACNREVVSELRTKVGPGDDAGERLEGATAKMKELESMLGDLISYARDKDDKLDASEWAVQQLGLIEMSKVKASLVQAEKDHIQLHKEFLELDKKLQFKEDELADKEKHLRLLRRELRKAEDEVETMNQNFQLAQAKYDGLKADHDAALSRIAGFEELKNNQVVISRHDDKLKEIRLELQRTKTNAKDLMERMLSLQSSLVHGNTENNSRTLVCSSSPGKNSPKSVELQVIRKCPTIEDQSKSCKRGRNINSRSDNDSNVGTNDGVVILEVSPKRQRQ